MKPPLRNDERPLQGPPNVDSRRNESLSDCSPRGAKVSTRTGSHGRRNENRGRPDEPVTRQAQARGAGSVREAWIDWLSPRFPSGSAYITGTYSDSYGFAHGLTLARNVHKDVRRFLSEHGFLSLDERHYICGVEPHLYRDILHWHGIIAGDFSPDDLRYLQAAWAAERGFCRALPVLDGCASYVTKYALKGDTDSFDWRLDNEQGLSPMDSGQRRRRSARPS